MKMVLLSGVLLAGFVNADSQVGCVEPDANNPQQCNVCAAGYGLNTVSRKCKRFLNGQCVAGSCDGSANGGASLGEYAFPGGNRYAGAWRDASDGGDPVFQLAEGEEPNASPWGIFHGLGTFQWADTGDRYDGDYVDGNKHGHGVMSWGDGKVYQGQWHHDNQHGNGILIDGAAEYAGQWQADKKNGLGQGEWRVDQDQAQDQDQGGVEMETYAGEWLNGHKHGSGVYTWPDKQKYMGDYNMDKLEGFGVSEFPNGNRYLGAFHNDFMHGCGRMSVGGELREGNWVNGELSEEDRCDDRCCKSAVMEAKKAKNKAMEKSRQAKKVADEAQLAAQTAQERAASAPTVPNTKAELRALGIFVAGLVLLTHIVDWVACRRKH